MPESPSVPPFVQPGDLLPDFLRRFWQRQIDTAEQETPDFRHPPLPLARIKKVMKSDPEVKMIASDAPILFCKACEIFISEITARAFIIADANKRRTLSRSDIAKALSKSDQFDFLIDIVPREEGHPGAKRSGAQQSQGHTASQQTHAPSQSHGQGPTPVTSAGSSAAGNTSVSLSAGPRSTAPGPSAGIIKRDEDLMDVLGLEEGERQMSVDADMDVGLNEMQTYRMS